MKSLGKLRRDALTHLGKLTNKRRRLLARFIDHAVFTNKKEDGTYSGMSMQETLEVHEALKDVRQLCEVLEEHEGANDNGNQR